MGENQGSNSAIGTVGSKEIAKAPATKKKIVSKRGIGFAAAKGSWIENCGEKKIVGHTEDGEGVSLRI